MSQLARGASPLLSKAAQLLVGSARKSPGLTPTNPAPNAPGGISPPPWGAVKGADGMTPPLVIVNVWGALAPPTPTEPKSWVVGVIVTNPSVRLLPLKAIWTTPPGVIWKASSAVR